MVSGGGVVWYKHSVSPISGPEQPGQTAQRGDPDHAAPDPAKHDAPKDGEVFQQRGVAQHASPGSSGAGPEQLDQMEQRGDPDYACNADRRAHARDDASLSEAGPAKKARTDTADTVPSSGSSNPSWAQLEQRAVALPKTAEDVMELRRLGPDLFEATKRSGESWVGDVELLKTLPQGIAKLATLEVRELMRARKARATREQNAVVATGAGGKSMEPPEKKPRTLQEHFGREDIGAAEHVDRMAVSAAAAQEEPDREMGASAATAQNGLWLFRHGTGNDDALIEWLRAQEAQPRCRSLLQQILEWGSHLDRAAMRKLVAAQGIPLSRKNKATIELLLEAARKHFRDAIPQEKGRLATLNLARRPLEPPVPPAANAEQRIAAADVIDLGTLKTYRRQHTDLPSEVKDAINSLVGGTLSNLSRMQATATSLGIHIQRGVQYPGGDKAERCQRWQHLQAQLKRTMLTAACIQRVRSWGATTPRDATRPSSMSRTPGTLPELANMLRDPEGRLRCPFGVDWENQSGGCSRLDRLHRIPFWLALMEMHGDGYRYGSQSDRHLPYVFDRLLDCLTQERIARQQVSRGASENLIGVPGDLERLCWRIQSSGTRSPRTIS